MFLIRARKERHFIDFGKRKKDELLPEADVKALTKHDLKPVDTFKLIDPDVELHDSKISTEF